MSMSKKTKKSIGKYSLDGWKDLYEDILAMVFNRLDPKSLFETAYSVCQSWRSVCRLILFSRGDGVLDLERFRNIGIDDGDQLMKLLKLILDGLQPQYVVAGIFFPERLHLSDKHLYYVAQRLPNLQILSLPYTTNMITGVGFSSAIQYWKELRYLYIGTFKFPDYACVIQEIGINCKNLEVLKIYSTEMKLDVKDGNMFVLDERTSLELAANLRQVKTLWFQGCLLYKLGLENILNKCSSLETIFIHSCRQATKIPKYHRTLKCNTSYDIEKCTKNDNTIEWHTYATEQEVYNSSWPMLMDLWDSERMEVPRWPVELLVS
ncbi:hypothetical protein FRX31_021329 [Thalictrum thalictroides]|uniref:F-box/LRR-repeat protein n=1 Tax=Thalictrum thalictroides TaxID=46969 RepID=A0A7J6VVF7_THATH|nr:hypothetical protein FRX31_021329 [Thalictrum thalictroides]